MDIDLDFVPNLSRDNTIAARGQLSDILKGYMAEQGYTLSEGSRFSHSLDAFHYNYINAAGNKDMIKIEINYSLRTHVFAPEERPILTDAFGEPIRVKTVAAMEIFSAKLNALTSRAAARDLYDFCNMIENKTFSGSENILRKCSIFYATISAKEVNKTFDTSAIDGITFAKIRAELFPVLAVREKFDLDARKQMAKTYIADTMKPIDSERVYMEHFVSGEYMPELLFDDKKIVERIKKHPMALWKCR